MPTEGADETSYKIKSRTNGQERIAREHQLENLDELAGQAG
jgi:hypothetical protein